MTTALMGISTWREGMPPNIAGGTPIGPDGVDISSQKSRQTGEVVNEL
jgi:hypothetical protein